MPEIDINRYGFCENDRVDFKGIINCSQTNGSVQEAIDFLREVYTGQISAEFLHLEVT